MNDSIIEKDINNALADTASSFLTVKESIEKILGKLQLVSPIKKQSDGQLYHRHRHQSFEESQIGHESPVKIFDLEKQLHDLLIPQQLELNNTLNNSLWDNSKSDDDFQFNELLIYGNRLLDEYALSTTSQSFNSICESENQSSTVPGVAEANSQKLNKICSVNDQTLISKDKWHCPTKLSLPIKCCSPSGILLNRKSKMMMKKTNSVEIISYSPSLPKFKTKRIRRRNNPNYDQKFSFELSPDVKDKRILMTVKNQSDPEKFSEVLGCMSFGISNITRKKVEGWYYLLTNDFGRKKHFAVNPKKS
ncbi:hypothetical protein CHUAL_006125 [Chamberlinius hualienensis]